MPDLDLKSMSDNELLDRHTRCNFLYTVFRSEIVIRLSALRAEVERLKAEAVVMRELCEADIRLWSNPCDPEAQCDQEIKLDAYRAMKAKHNVK